MLLRCEKETVIILNDAEKVAQISTSQDWMKRKFKKLAEEHPDEVKIISELLGHANVKVTYDTYIHLIETQKYDVLKYLNNENDTCQD